MFNDSTLFSPVLLVGARDKPVRRRKRSSMYWSHVLNSKPATVYFCIIQLTCCNHPHCCHFCCKF